MNPLSAASLLLHCAAGAALGLLYFGGVWRDARRIAGAGRLSGVVAAMAARFILLGAALTLASMEGAMPLLTMALGVLIGRGAVLRMARAATA